jgi:cytochrome bd ubiquinol oxidase subunit II
MNAASGALLCASAFSGFYLALMIVLWLLILRALGIELRMHLELSVWRTFIACSAGR